MSRSCPERGSFYFFVSLYLTDHVPALSDNLKTQRDFGNLEDDM